MSKSYTDKVIRVTNKNSKYYRLLGLVAHETKSLLRVISFVENTPQDCRASNQILVKERPFRVFTVSKNSVEPVSERNINKDTLKRARGQAYHWVLGYKTSKPHFKWTTITTKYDCSKYM